MAAVFKPEEPSPPLTPEREAARQLGTVKLAGVQAGC